MMNASIMLQANLARLPSRLSPPPPHPLSATLCLQALAVYHLRALTGCYAGALAL
jgi:hypothetical protein